MSNTSDYFPPQTTNTCLNITTGTNAIPVARPSVYPPIKPRPLLRCPHCGRKCSITERGVRHHVKRYCKSTPPTQEKT